jgi:ATP-dependent HslUV protease ATP-binding subunit HslU
MQTYKRHERSREAIELAYDAILQEKMKVRHRLGFQPPQRGRRRDAQGDALVRTLLLESLPSAC